ncbi:a15bc24c-71a1-4a50-a794-a82c2da2d263 [Thermothielavioides terrestris]|uniref:A15bc24c-71a1-4a50-a794-a82c2da2d263 n=1 Tax=Thermothielavioides terrestris TaxID=2587410 RepID=A0A3S4F3D4_9PEZI|nr:a15bc24c-71a1-4a50-a794-a82c2da2d263 [Thermothielavioides terrestris]
MAMSMSSLEGNRSSIWEPLLLPVLYDETSRLKAAVRSHIPVMP